MKFDVDKFKEAIKKRIKVITNSKNNYISNQLNNLFLGLGNYADESTIITIIDKDTKKNVTDIDEIVINSQIETNLECMKIPDDLYYDLATKLIQKCYKIILI